MEVDYKVLNTDQLEHFIIRDIRQGSVDELVERFKNGYNPSKPLTVVECEGKYLVANGNHRLKAMGQMDILEVPCVIHTDADPYKLAVEGNADEDTYSPMDVFDWIEVIENMKEEGYTQQDIADRIGWSRQKVNDYQTLINKIDAIILEIAKDHQKGRASVNDAIASFTEGWFRNSGLYQLDELYQKLLMDDFITDKCKWNANKVKSESAKYKRWMDFIGITKQKLVNQDDLDEMVNLIETGSFKTEDQLLSKIKDFNEKAENKLINGDSLTEMEELEDGSIDLVITDPPYGIDYSSNRSEFSNHVTKEKIDNDSDLEGALELTNDALEILDRKTKENAHVYLFTGWRVYPQFKEIVEKYFDIKNLIIWDKGNHGTGDLEGSWGNRYEMIIFATKGNRKLVKRKADIIKVNKLSSSEMIHPTQKPGQLIKELLESSAHTKDTVIDPFMGSGSTIKSVKEYGDLNYIGIELDKEKFDKANSFIGGN